MNIPLQYKILSGYLILIAVIGYMAAIILYEHGQLHKIEADYAEVREAHRIINTAHRQITILATYGGSVIVWDEGNCHTCRERRLRTDLLLQQMKVLKTARDVPASRDGTSSKGYCSRIAPTWS